MVPWQISRCLVSRQMTFRLSCRDIILTRSALFLRAGFVRRGPSHSTSGDRRQAQNLTKRASPPRAVCARFNSHRADRPPAAGPHFPLGPAPRRGQAP